MSPVNLVGWGVAFPALISALVFVATRLIFQRLRLERAESAAGGLAIGLGYLAGHGSLAMPAFPPIDVTDRIPWIVGLAMLLELAEAVSPAPLWARLENRLLLIACVAIAILGPILSTTLETKAGTIWFAVIVVIALLSLLSVEAQAKRAATAATLLSRIAILIAMGIALLASGSVILGELGLSLAASFGVVALLTLKSGRAAGGLVIGAAGVAFLIDGYIYASLPASVAAVLIAAPIAGWIGAIPALKKEADWKASVIVMIATLVILGIAIGLALAASPSCEG